MTNTKTKTTTTSARACHTLTDDDLRTVQGGGDTAGVIEGGCVIAIIDLILAPKRIPQ